MTCCLPLWVGLDASVGVTERAANLARRSSRILTLEEGEAGLSGLYDRYFDALSRSLD